MKKLLFSCLCIVSIYSQQAQQPLSDEFYKELGRNNDCAAVLLGKLHLLKGINKGFNIGVLFFGCKEEENFILENSQLIDLSPIFLADTNDTSTSDDTNT